MKKILYASIFISCSALCGTSCKSEADKDTLLLKKFLAQHFKETISDSLTYYLLVPDNQCVNCIHWDGRKRKENLVVISSMEPAHFVNFKKVLFDKDGKLLRLPFINYGNKLVCTDSGNIKAILPITDFNYQIDSLDKLYRR